MKTKQEAMDEARKCLGLMTTKGWKIRVHENMGWHWCLMNRYIALHKTGDRYWCLMTTDLKHAGSGEISLSDDKDHHDPNEAVAAQMEIFSQFTKKHQRVLTTMKDSFSGKLPTLPDDQPDDQHETLEFQLDL